MKTKINRDILPFFDKKKLELNLSSQILTAQDIKELVVPFLNTHAEIKSLNLSYNNIRAEGARALALNQSLITLNLCSNNIKDEGAKALADNKSLTALNLRTNNIRDEGAKALAANLNLSTLDVCLNNIGVEGTKALAEEDLMKRVWYGPNPQVPSLRSLSLFAVKKELETEKYTEEEKATIEGILEDLPRGFNVLKPKIYI